MGSLLFGNKKDSNTGLIGMVSQIKQFMNSPDSANAEQKVKELLSSGKMSQQQFENLKSQAEQLARFFK